MKKENRDKLNRKVVAHIQSSVKPQRSPTEKEIRAALNKAQKDTKK